MNNKASYTDIAEGFAAAAARMALFEAEAAHALADEGASPLMRRELKDRAEALAERVRLYFAANPTVPAGEDDAGSRAARLFIAELRDSLEENARFLERRFGASGVKAADAEAASADRAFRALSGEYAPAAGSADSLGLVASRAAELARLRDSARAESEVRLERELLAVKLKSFAERARLAGAQNAELLFKARLALEKRLGSTKGIVVSAKSRTEGELALAPGPEGAFEAELYQKGVRLRMLFLPGGTAGASVSGSIEAGGESSNFSLVDPSGRLGTGSAASFPSFLERYELKSLYEGLREAAARLETAAKAGGGNDPSGRLSSALDGLLG